MKINAIQYNEKYQALEIYCAGCLGFCVSCQNKELWDFDNGVEWYKFNNKLDYLSENLVKQCWCLGGDLSDSADKDAEDMLLYISQFNKPIMLWTRYELQDIPGNILQYCNYVKTGSYDCNSESYQEPLFGITLASLNQKIIKLK